MFGLFPFDFKVDEAEIILGGIFTLLTIFIAIWALYWSGLVKDGDKLVFIILQVIPGLIVFGLLYLFMNLSYLQYLQIFIVIGLLIIIGVLVSLFIPRIRSMSAGHVNKTAQFFSELRDRVAYERNEVLLAFDDPDPNVRSSYLSKAYSSIIKDVIPNSLSLFSNTKNFEVALFFCEPNYKFSIKESLNISREDQDKAISDFSWDPQNPISLAGYSAANKQIVNITKTSDYDTCNMTQYWASLPRINHRPPSIFCQPIIVGPPEGEFSYTIGVLCVLSEKKNAWSKVSIESIMKSLAEDIETLMYLILFHFSLDLEERANREAVIELTL